MKYAIYEENLDRLEKKLKSIENKCNKYNVEFHYERVGEEFRKVKDESGRIITVRYILVDVEGSVKHDDWKFIATIEHTENGNIIRQFVTDIEVPVRYYTTEPICEHCNTNRRRKDTYLIHNDVTDEWKQVGKSCLKEFTQGLDADQVARYVSYFDTLIKGEEPYEGVSFRRYYEVNQMVRFAFETVKHFGYQPNTEEYDRPTKARVLDYFNYVVNHRCSSIMADQIEYELADSNFNPDSEDIQKIAEDAITWIRNVKDAEYGYLHNLQMACLSDYCTSRDIGILISLAAAYKRHLKDEREKAERETKLSEEKLKSEYVGEIGDSLSFTARNISCIYSTDTIYGMNYMYKFYDDKGRVYMWSTSKWLDVDSMDTFEISGKVKQHEEYKGVKQTWLTRCKIKEEKRI